MSEVYGIKDSALNQQETEDKLCLICYCEKIDTIILPCKHMCVCSECSVALQTKSKQCPMCRIRTLLCPYVSHHFLHETAECLETGDARRLIYKGREDILININIISINGQTTRAESEQMVQG